MRVGHSRCPLLGRGGRHRGRPCSPFPWGGRRGEHRLSPGAHLAILGEDGGPEGPGANHVVPSLTRMRGYLCNRGVATPTRSPTAACGRATSGWRTSPGGHVYPGTARSATSVGGHNVHREEIASVLADKSRHARCGRRAPERRRSGRGGGGASAGPGPEHTPDPWSSCVTLPRSIWPPKASPGNGRAHRAAAHRAAAHRGREGVVARSGSRTLVPDTPAVSMAPGGATGAEINGAACLEQHAHNFPGVLRHLVKTVRFLWRPSFHSLSAGRRDPEGGSNVYRATVMLPIGVMIKNSIATGLTSAPPGTVGILPTANARQIWPT